MKHDTEDAEENAVSNVDDLVVAEDLDDTEDRIEFLFEYFRQSPLKAENVLGTYDQAYRCSGVSSLRKFLTGVATRPNFPPDMQLRAVESLLSFQEHPETIDDDDSDSFKQIKADANACVSQRNAGRVAGAVQVLIGLIGRTNCSWGDGCMPTLLKYKAIVMLARHGGKATDEKVERFMNDLITTNRLEAEFRYKLVRRLEHEKYVSTDIYGNMLLSFLGHTPNPTTLRILSAQNLLAGDFDKTISKDVILIQVLIFACDEELDTFVRADAADTLIGFGNEDDAAEGRRILDELGTRHGGLGIYNNHQNVHAESIESSIDGGIEKLKVIADGPLESFDECRRKVTCEWDALDDKERNKNVKIADTAFDRINYDSRLFRGLDLKTLFQMVCTVIANEENPETKSELYKRCAEEILDMANTCSSGMASRMINVLSGFGSFQLAISFKEQIQSNFVGRLNALVKLIGQKAESGNHPFFDACNTDIVHLWMMNKDTPFDVPTDARSRSAQFADDIGNRDDTLAIPQALPALQVGRTTHVPSHQESRKTRVAKWLESFGDEERRREERAAREDFAENLLTEFDASCPYRLRFSLFMTYAFSSLRSQMEEEFRQFVTPDEFELYMRDALAFYEGC